MYRSHSCPGLGSSLKSTFVFAAWWLAVALPASAAATNPIARIARVFNDDLVALESRISTLRDRQASLAAVRICPLENGFGFMGGRPDPNGKAPWVTLDLGRELPVESLFLVPAQHLPGEAPCLFPRRFRIEVALHEDFSDAVVLLEQSSRHFSDPHGLPLVVFGKDIPMRYVRLTVLEGCNYGVQDAYALSELLVFSEGEPVSFGARVTCSWRNQMLDGWGPWFLTDSRMPLGLWEGGSWSPTSGFHFPGDDKSRDPVEIVIDLGRDYPIDRVQLLPLECSLVPGVAIMPRNFDLSLTPQDSDEATPLFRCFGTDRPIREVSAQVITARGRSARFVRLTCKNDPPSLASKRITPGLAEVEIYSRGSNVAQGATVRVWQGHKNISSETDALTDGFTSRRQSLPLRTWLMQVAERARIDRELDDLVPLRHSMASESEINATWFAAMAIGLTFLIPVAIVERRRHMSREHVDVLRQRIASDLHDDIGSNLGSISMIARGMRRDLAEVKGTGQVLTDLSDVESIARESSQAMRDIVWLIERKHDTIGDLVKRLRETASRLLRDIDYEIRFDSRDDTSRLCLDSKRHLFLFCKEAMHNVAKHAKATHFSLSLENDGAWLRIEACDNGVGFYNANSGRKATAQKLRERAKVLAGDFEISSSKECGTKIVLRIPYSVLQSRIPV